MIEYRTIIGEYEFEEEIKKSRFITHIKQCETEQESIDFIEKIRSQNRTATHNCYSYINGENMITQRYSDDGEPQGTAGIPMLEVLKKEGITNICAVVTRYFGGIKLGASGLIRAYGSGVSNALKNIKIIDMKFYYELEVKFDYVFLGKIDNYIQNYGFNLKSRYYEDKIINIFYIKKDQLDNFKNNLVEFTSGNIEINELKYLLLPENENKLYEV